MQTNPYLAPTANLDTGDRWSWDLKNLWQIALYQKCLMIVQFILFAIILFITFYVQIIGTLLRLPIETDGYWFWGIIIATGVSLLLVTICITVLCSKCWNLAIGAGAFVGMLIPGVNLILMLVINSLITKRLRNYNVRVGLFGANMNDIRIQQQEDIGNAVSHGLASH
ncbi:MAG: hypothetical protein ACKVK0_07695 [Pirellulales bacterium]|jgi:hypothetical protein